MAAAILAGLLLGINTRVLAQSPSEIQAGAWLQSAEQLADENGDTAAVTAAYEKALMAYDELGDFDNSLKILTALVRVNYAACLEDEAIGWAENAVARFGTDRRDFDLNDRIYDFTYWVDGLISLYWRTDQMAQIYDTYGAALDNIATLAPRLQDWPLSDVETRYLRSQLSLPSIDSGQVTMMQQRLFAAHSRAGAITEIEGLLSDASSLLAQNEPPFETVSVLVQQALKLSRLHNYPPGELKSVVLYGRQALQAGNYRQAVTYGETALTRFDHIQQTETLLEKVHYILAKSHQELGNDLEAIDHYQTLLELIQNGQRLRDPAEREVVITNLIRLYERTGQPDLANQLASERRNPRSYYTSSHLNLIFFPRYRSHVTNAPSPSTRIPLLPTERCSQSYPIFLPGQQR